MICVISARRALYHGSPRASTMARYFVVACGEKSYK